jgi:DNA-binding response OmpR family regulator
LSQSLFAEIDATEDGLEDLNKMNERDHDIVLIALRLPRMSELGLVEQIRKKSRSQIVMPSSAHDDEKFVEILAPYNVKLLTKPLKINELFEMLVPLCEQLC